MKQKSPIEERVASLLGVHEARQITQVQKLWSGYGAILKFGVPDKPATVIVKHIAPMGEGLHPRGWNTSRSHERKVHSYQVEANWYAQWSPDMMPEARFPKCIALDREGEDTLLILEDLDAAGFPLRKTTVTLAEIKACLSWLAHFHAQFMGRTPEGLWEEGTYWHLGTRRDEWDALEDLALKQAAAPIDRALHDAQFQTIVHGDAKLANFCFSHTGTMVAAVDFQYVGGGCGMKDVAYFIGSCLDEKECARQEESLLDHYFMTLRTRLKNLQFEGDIQTLEQEWRALFPVAWADFFRFLQGWSPGHWKINGYSQRLTRRVIQSLNL